MKIKTKQKLNLPELIEHVWEKDDVLGEFTSNCGTTLYTSNLGSIRIEHAHKYIGKEELFTVEVEEELTEDTEFEELWESYWNSEDSIMMTRSMSARIRIGDDVVSINGIKSTNGDIFKTVAIFYKDTLIWSAESGIPESGVLEVDDE